MRELQTLLPPLLRLCRSAGEAVLDHYHGADAGHYRAKADDSPLTRADLTSHRMLVQGLRALEPGLPVLSEEAQAPPFETRRAWPTYWLVDPLDGTREYLNRTGDFTINIALIDAQRPVLGVIYAPLTCLAYTGVPGHGARLFRFDGGGDGSHRPLAARPLRRGRPLVMLASPRHSGRRLQLTQDWLATHWGEVQRRDRGGALKFCLLAEGSADVYPRFSPCCEWDVGAGQALLEAAGGRLVGLDGEPLRYNRRDSLYSPHFVAMADPSQALWGDLLREMPAAR